MSAAINLAALFPPSEQKIWHEEIGWQPVPVHTIPWVDDYYLGGQAPCARFDSLKKQFSKEKGKDHKQLFRYLEAHSGLRIWKTKQALLLYDTLAIEQARNMT